MWYNGTIIHVNDLEGVRRDQLVQYTYMYMIIYILFVLYCIYKISFLRDFFTLIMYFEI